MPAKVLVSNRNMLQRLFFAWAGKKEQVDRIEAKEAEAAELRRKLQNEQETAAKQSETPPQHETSEVSDSASGM